MDSSQATLVRIKDPYKNGLVRIFRIKIEIIEEKLQLTAKDTKMIANTGKTSVVKR
jgi:hypothetical protein